MERFGYPDFLLASADELVHGQYADRPQLRPIYEAIVAAALQISLTKVEELDAEVLDWMQLAFDENS